MTRWISFNSPITETRRAFIRNLEAGDSFSWDGKEEYIVLEDAKQLPGNVWAATCLQSSTSQRYSLDSFGNLVHIPW